MLSPPKAFFVFHLIAYHWYRELFQKICVSLSFESFKHNRRSISATYHAITFQMIPNKPKSYTAVYTMYSKGSATE